MAGSDGCKDVPALGWGVFVIEFEGMIVRELFGEGLDFVSSSLVLRGLEGASFFAVVSPFDCASISTCFRGLGAVELVAHSGRDRRPSTMMGDMTSRWVAVVVDVVTPQSSKSGSVSSSSRAQSIWLLGVDGLWSIATALTR